MKMMTSPVGLEVNETSYLLFDGCQTVECCIGKSAVLAFATAMENLQRSFGLWPGAMG